MSSLRDVIAWVRGSRPAESNAPVDPAIECYDWVMPDCDVDWNADESGGLTIRVIRARDIPDGWPHG